MHGPVGEGLKGGRAAGRRFGRAPADGPVVLHRFLPRTHKAAHALPSRIDVRGNPRRCGRAGGCRASCGNRRIGIGETPPMSDLTPANARPGNWFRPKPALFCRPPPVRLRLFSPPQTRRNCRARPEPWSGVPLARAAPPPRSGNPVPGPAFYGSMASPPPDCRCTAPSSPQAQGADDGQGVSPPPRRGALFVGLTVSDAGTRPRPTALMRG